jgi:type VI secretion system protein ImpM
VDSELLGWYGKLPSSGDFIARGLPREVVQKIDDWVQGGLIQFRHRSPDWRYYFAYSTPWAFAMPAGVLAASAVKGYICASADRVGRLFPLVILSEVGSAETSVSPTDPWFGGVAQLLTRAIREQLAPEIFEAEVRSIGRANAPTKTSPLQSVGAGTGAGAEIMDILNSAPTGASTAMHKVTSAPITSLRQTQTNMSVAFDPAGNETLWWAHLGADQAPPVEFTPFVHRGALTSGLFIVLFSGT